MDDVFHDMNKANKHMMKDVSHEIFGHGGAHHNAHMTVSLHGDAHHSPHLSSHHDSHKSPHMEVKIDSHGLGLGLGHTLAHAVKGITHAVSHVVGVQFIDNSNRIWVTLNQHAYVGGDMVLGTVEMDCLVPFVAKGVIIKLKGFERVWFQQQVQEWEGEGQNRRSVMRIHEFKENKEFFKTSIIVNPQSGTVNPGHYSFPFSYQLPPNLPGTYCEEGGDKHHGNAFFAKILYKAKATVDVAFRHDLKKTTKLIVNEKFDQLLAPSFAENSKNFLTGGSLHVRTWLDKNAYFPGDTLICKLKANNTSVKPTRKISIRVHHHLELKAHGQHFRHTHCVYEQNYAGFDPCFLGTRYMPFFIPVGLRPSSLQGHHVRSEYAFQIECDIPGAIDLNCTLPCRLLAPQFLYSSVPPQPPNAPLPPNVCIRPPWQPDSAANSCGKCSAGFSLFKRRHHCRHCSQVFCADCTKQKTSIKKLKYKDAVRVCDACFPTASAGGNKHQSTKVVYQQWLQQQQQQMQPVPM